MDAQGFQVLPERSSVVPGGVFHMPANGTQVEREPHVKIRFYRN
jgi:hypothetical protein